MRRCVSVALLTALLFNCAGIPRHYLQYDVAGPIIISPHVGDTIDPEERERYGLFQQVSGFKTASFYSIDGGGFEVHIVADIGKLIAVNRDPSAIGILRDYINRCDEIRESPIQFEKQWTIVGYDELGLAITQHEVNRVKNNAGCIGCMAGAISAVAVETVLLMWPKLMDASVYHEIFLASFSLATLSILSIIFGRKIDRNAALRAITEARKPKIVE